MYDVHSSDHLANSLSAGVLYADDGREERDPGQERHRAPAEAGQGQVQVPHRPLLQLYGLYLACIQGDSAGQRLRFDDFIFEVLQFCPLLSTLQLPGQTVEQPN